MHDPEDLARERREQRRDARPPRVPADPAAAAPSPHSAQTEQLLRRVREGDTTFAARRLLAIVRADRRPIDQDSLRQAIDDVAAEEGLSSDQVRANLDVALQLEGSTLDAWEKDLRRRRARPGRSNSEPQQLLLQAVPR